MSVLCHVCHVFPPLVSIFGLFPVLVKCDHWFILVQLCLSRYLWLSCVFIVLSVQFDLVWSTRYSPVFLSMSALSCPALMSPLKTVYLSLPPRLRVPCSSSCVHRDKLICVKWYTWLHNVNSKDYSAHVWRCFIVTRLSSTYWHTSFYCSFVNKRCMSGAWDRFPCKSVICRNYRWMEIFNSRSAWLRHNIIMTNSLVNTEITLI